ncbi:MAG: hypothetical protein OXS29_14030 [bacterium]|nr:hypothetical protein [bacterium]MDE0287269.1 hypothetical protein [bacterium]MDE0438994.1 hypothetical protein [bacterium]
MSVGERRLGEVLTLDLNPVQVEATARYPVAGVHNSGRGLFKRNDLSGFGTSYKKLHHLRAGQLVLSRLQAFKGGIAVVTPEFDGFHLSPEFLTFSRLEEELDAQFLSYLCAWPDFWQRVASGHGQTGTFRPRVHPRRFLELRFPIPDIDSQRITAQTLAYHRQQVRALEANAKRATELSETAAVALACRPDLSELEKGARGWTRVPLRVLMEQVAHPVSVDPTETYPSLGLYHFGRGVYRKEPLDGSRTSATTLNRVSAGQFIYSKNLAFEGAYARIPMEFDGFFVSGEFPTFQTHAAELDPLWLAIYMQSASNWMESGTWGKGLGRRRQRLSIDSFLAFEIWRPPLAEQRRARRKIQALARHRNLRIESELFVAALWPSILHESMAKGTASPRMA